MRPKQHLNAWLKGKSVHNPKTDQCVPDYSCCSPDNKLAAKPLREKFVAAFNSGDDAVWKELQMDFACNDYLTEEQYRAEKQG